MPSPCTPVICKYVAHFDLESESSARAISMLNVSSPRSASGNYFPTHYPASPAEQVALSPYLIFYCPTGDSILLFGETLIVCTKTPIYLNNARR